MTMLDFIANYNLSANSGVEFYDPGTAHVAPLWACKLGVQAAMNDIKNNHPNDYVSLIFFSRAEELVQRHGLLQPGPPAARTGLQPVDRLPLVPPLDDRQPGDGGPALLVRQPGRPPVQRRDLPGDGADAGLQPVQRQLVAPELCPLACPERRRRRARAEGPQKLVILETDGMANMAANASWTNSGATNSYYNVRAPDEYPSNSGSVTSQVLRHRRQNLRPGDATARPGYSTTRKPVLIHTLAFGSLFEPSAETHRRQRAA